MKKGFTLIELLIVIAILAILGSMIVSTAISLKGHDTSSDVVIVDKKKTAEPFPEKKPVEKAKKLYNDDKWGDSESRY